MTKIIWLRQDLRIRDNAALYYACQSQSPVIAVYFITPQQWQNHDMAGCKVDFILRNLRLLSVALADRQIPLRVFNVDTFKDIPQVLLSFAKENQCSGLFFNAEYEVNEQSRDREIQNIFNKENIKVSVFTDQVIVNPGELLTAQGRFYTVFTPFKKAWISKVKSRDITVYPAPQKMPMLGLSPSTVPSQVLPFHSSISVDYWPAGETAAHQRLEKFINEKIDSYQNDRDFPAIDATSQLSPYLAIGVLSPRQCLRAALQVNQGELDSGNSGVKTWINELIWREFYKHIMVGFPRVCKYQSFQQETEKLAWCNEKHLLLAWQEGRTGFPIIDAGMRQLKTTGWMHNRLRMLTAMFLTKDLLMDWRLGEKFFMQHLIDGDLAANNGGWQWSASTGTDAAPYFRVFNPTTQSKKFDPEGNFIRRYVPELTMLSNAEIHDPFAGGFHQSLSYPKPIINHQWARERVLEAFKKLRA